MSWILRHTKKGLAAACTGRRIYIFVSTNFGEAWIHVTKKDLFTALTALNIKKGYFQVDTEKFTDLKQRESIRITL